MQGNITTAAWVFGSAMVLASVVLVVGIFISVQFAADHFTSNARQHAAAIEQAGTRSGEAFGQSFEEFARIMEEDLLAAIGRHGQSVEAAGETVGEAFESPVRVTVATPRNQPMTVNLAAPLQLEQPVVIEGTRGENQALSVEASIFE